MNCRVRVSEQVMNGRQSSASTVRAFARVGFRLRPEFSGAQHAPPVAFMSICLNGRRQGHDQSRRHTVRKRMSRLALAAGAATLSLMLFSGGPAGATNHPPESLGAAG